MKEHGLIQRKRIHQIHIRIEDERCKILQIDTRLEEIVDTTSYFLDRSQDILEILKGIMVWVETNKESTTEPAIKDQQTLKQEYELLEFANNVAEEFKKTVKKTKTTCAKFCRRALSTHNQCHTSAEKRLDVLPKHELFLKNLQDRYQEDEQEIQQVKDLDELIFKNLVAQVVVSIHLLEYQLCLSTARIERIKTQAAKYEINIRFLEPFGFEGIAADAHAWKKYINKKAGPSS